MRNYPLMGPTLPVPVIDAADAASLNSAVWSSAARNQPGDSEPENGSTA